MRKLNCKFIDWNGGDFHIKVEGTTVEYWTLGSPADNLVSEHDLPGAQDILYKELYHQVVSCIPLEILTKGILEGRYAALNARKYL